MATTTEEAAKPEAFDWDAATARERDAWVAEKVMGWVWGVTNEYRIVETPGGPWHGFGPSRRLTTALPEPMDLWDGDDAVPIARDAYARIPRYTTDPAADFEVLKRVRREWGMLASKDRGWDFHYALCRVWEARRDSRGVVPLALHLMYEPGDYSKAAYLALSPPAT